MAKQRIVITGLGVVSPIGVGREQFWKGLSNGVSGVRPISTFVPFDSAYRFAFEVPELDYARQIGPRGLERLDRTTKFLLLAAKLAFKDARFKFDGSLRPDVGIAIGTDWGHLQSNFRFHSTILLKGPSKVNPMDFPGTLANSATSQVSMRYGLAGPNATIARGFSSGLDAMGYAVNLMKNYGIKTVVTGGVENLSIEYYTMFYKIGWLLRAEKNVKTACRPFDRDRSGLLLGEGAGVLILEEMQAAKKRGARIFAEVAGYGFSFGSDAQDIQRCMVLALENSKMKPTAIDYISASANGSVFKDKQEQGVLSDLFGSRPVVSSVKSMVGECFGASGVLQAAAACLSLSRGVVPPTVNFRKADPGAGQSMISNKKINKKINTVLINAFGLEGNNACLILTKPHF